VLSKDAPNNTCEEDGVLIAKRAFGEGSNVIVKWLGSTYVLWTCDPPDVNTSEVVLKFDPAIVIVCDAPSAVIGVGVIPVTTGVG
jgi:hypothetical protein